MLSLLLIAGGVALLLFGVRYLRKGLDRLFGPRLGPWLGRFASNPVSSFLSGLGASLLAPSSTTMSLLAVQTVQAGHLTTRQMIAVMLGANIGLTVMVQLIALELDRLAPLAVLVGFALFQYTRASRSRGVGQVILAFGFIFLAMGVIRGVVTDGGLTENADFIQLISIAERYPLLLLALAAVLALLLQSSTATIGVVIGLGAVGAITLPVVVPVVLGANIGLSFTTLIVGWRRLDSRRLATCNLLLKSFVATVVLLAMLPLEDRLPVVAPAVMPLVVANMHTGFNVIVAIVGLPALGIVTRLVERMVTSSSPEQVDPYGPRFIGQGPIGGMALALGQSRREILHMAEIIRSMLDDVWTALSNDNAQLARDVAARDDYVDELDNQIKRYLTRLVREESDDYDADEQMRQLRFLTELETIGDIIDKSIAELVLKKIRVRARFSVEGMQELDEFHRHVIVDLETAATAIGTRDRRLAHQLIRDRVRLKQFGNELRERHFARLNAGLSETVETSAIHLDMLTHLERVNSALVHVAYAILADAESGEWRGERPRE